MLVVFEYEFNNPRLCEELLPASVFLPLCSKRVENADFRSTLLYLQRRPQISTSLTHNSFFVSRKYVSLNSYLEELLFLRKHGKALWGLEDQHY